MSTEKLLLDSSGDFHADGKMTKTFGIAIKGGVIAPFVPIGEEYPNSGSYTFSTQEDYQDQITIAFHKSSQDIACGINLLALIRITDFKLDKAGVPKIRIHYEIANNKILIWATNDRKDKKIKLTTIKNSQNEYIN